MEPQRYPQCNQPFLGCPPCERKKGNGKKGHGRGASIIGCPSLPHERSGPKAAATTPRRQPP
eukprot:3193862-Pyramimonas_sp.AAC.1